MAFDEFQEKLVCEDCLGAGGWWLGNCEDGEWENCIRCDGRGEIAQ